MATKKIDFEKIEKQFFPQQVELWEKNFNGSRETALLYLWFFNNVSVSWKAIKNDNGREMYRTFAVAVSSKLLEADNGGKN